MADVPASCNADLLTRVSVALDYSPERVWPYVLNWTRWVTGYVVRHVSGPAAAAGEVQQIRHFDEDATLRSEYWVKVVEVVPVSRLVYKILSPSYEYIPGNSSRREVALTGYDIFELRREPRGLTLSVDILAQMECPGMTEVEIGRFEQEHAGSAHNHWQNTYFPRLSRLLSQEE